MFKSLTRNLRRATRKCAPLRRLLFCNDGSLYFQSNEFVKLFADAAINDKFVLGKSGSDQNHVQIVATIADEPAYLVMDSTARAGLTVLDEPLKCRRLGQGGMLVWASAANAISDGDDLVSYGNGQVASLQTLIGGGTHGTYWKVGIAVADSALGGVISTGVQGNVGTADGIQFMDIEPAQVTF